MAGTTKATYHLHERETIGQALADARGREPVLGSASGVIGILPEGGGTQYVPMFKDTLPTDGNVPCFSSTGNLLDIGDGEMKIYPGNPDGVVVGASKLGTAMLEICGWFDTDYLLQSWYDQTGDVRAELGLDSVGSAYFTMYDADDVPHTIDADVIGTLVGSSVNWDSAYAHISESGASHTYIDQSVTTTADVQHDSISIGNNDFDGRKLRITSVAAESASSQFIMDTFSATTGNQASFALRKSASDTINTKAATAAGEDLGEIAVYGVDSGNTGYRAAAQILFRGDAAPGGTAVPGKILIRTSNGTSLQDALIIDDGQNINITGDVTIDASLTANSLSVLGSASSGGAVGTFKGFEDGAGILVGPQTGEYTTETVMKYYHSGEGSDSFDWIYTYEDHGYLTLENSTGTTSLLLSDNSFHLKSGTSNSQSRIEGDLNNLELICPPSGTIKLTGNADVDGNINIGGTYSASATPGISGTFCSSTGTISFKNGIVVQFTS